MIELTLDYAVALNRGLVRQRNEDRCGAFEPEEEALRAERGRLFVVVDGMGGHAAGDLAAETAVRSVQDTYFRGAWHGPLRGLRSAFSTANRDIIAAAHAAGQDGMGAAAVAVAIIKKRAVVAHLGDCRGYLIRAGQALRLTTDHSWVQERITLGRLSEGQAQDHPYRNVLTRALGTDTQAHTDVSETAVHPGDALLLCSDGLWGLAEDHELAAIISSTANAAAATGRLVELALARGGVDNISAIVVRVVGPASEATTIKLSRSSLLG